jgi:hypothetical protein
LPLKLTSSSSRAQVALTSDADSDRRDCVDAVEGAPELDDELDAELEGLALALLGLAFDSGVEEVEGVGATLGTGAAGAGAAVRVAPLLMRARPTVINTKIATARRTRTRRNQYVPTGSGPSGWSMPLMGRA